MENKQNKYQHENTPEYFRKLLTLKNDQRTPCNDHHLAAASARSPKGQRINQTKPIGSPHDRIGPLNYNFPTHRSNQLTELNTKRKHSNQPEQIINPQLMPTSTNAFPHAQKPTTSADDDNNAWIHCNYCFEPYFKKQKALFLLSCHHVLCESCLKPPHNKEEYKCNMCDKKVRRRQINNNLPGHLKELFHPAPWEDGFDLTRIYNFQSNHREHLMKNMEKMRERLLKAQEISQQLVEKNAELDEEYKRTYNISAKLIRNVREIANRREQEKALNKKEHYDGSASFVAGSLQGEVAQRCVPFVSSRGGYRRSPSVQSDKNRDFHKQKSPNKIQSTNNVRQDVTFFTTPKSHFKL